MCFRFETFMRIPFLLLVICCSSVFAQQLPPAPKAHVIDVTPNAGYFNEPAIAVNPKDPQQAVVAWQVPASAAYSHDGGETWKIAEGTAPEMYRVSGDVSLAYDAAGHAILCYIAFDKLGSTNYWARGATRNGIFIRRSLDGGQTWEHDARTVISHESTPDIPFEDKPWIVADTSGPHAGNLYIGWTHFTLAASELMFSRSTDDGITWSSPIKLSSVPGLPRDDNGALEGFHGVVGPDGALYTIWDARDGIMMAVSHDGGASFSKDRLIIPAGPGYFGITGVSRSNGFPQIGMDMRGKHGGKLYVAWSDYSNGDVDVFVSSSADYGKTWSAPVRVNTDPIHNGNDQFFQWMAVDPQSGAVNLIFYDRRTDNEQTTVTLARSTDGGKTFQNYIGTRKGSTLKATSWVTILPLLLLATKSLARGRTRHRQKPKTERGKKTRTVLRVGTADFN